MMMIIYITILFVDLFKFLILVAQCDGPSVSHEICDDSVGDSAHGLHEFQEHHTSVPLRSNLIHLGGQGHTEDHVDLTDTEVVIDYLS